MARWNPLPVVAAVVLAGAVFALEWFLGVAPVDALVDATLAALIVWEVLEYWRG